MKTEILAPAGSLDAVKAAVQNGADAVYMGYGEFNARRNAKNFTKEEMAEAISYCRARGVKTNLTVNIIVSDRELENAMKDIAFLNELGVDALIVQDLGIARLVKEHFPDIEIHGSTQMTVNTLDGALFAKQMGFSRVVLSRETSIEDIRYITANCGIETEVFVHGALCMCYSGQCYLSSVIGQRSGNRGLCAQPCRLPYSYNESKNQEYPLSLKDLSLASYMREIVDAGVACVKIEGRMKRPEYTAIVTKIYADLVKEYRQPTEIELEVLQKVFSRQGFTQGYFLGKKGKEMFGTKTDVPMEDVKDLYKQAVHTFREGVEVRKNSIDFIFTAKFGQTISLTAKTGQSEVQFSADEPQVAMNKPTTKEAIEKNLLKLGGTVFEAGQVMIDIDDGVMVPASVINGLRRDCVENLTNSFMKNPELRHIPYKYVKSQKENIDFEGYTVEVRKMEQITDTMIVDKPYAVYIPLTEICDHIERTKELLGKGLNIVASLPRIFTDAEKPIIDSLLNKAKHIGIQSILVSNVGQIVGVKDFAIFGDFGLNIFNSEAMKTIKELGVVHQTLSFELKLPQIRDMFKGIDTEIVVYGHMPLMIFENCAIKNKKQKCVCKKEKTYLTDRMGKKFELLPEFGCRNTLLNSQPLYFGSKSSDYKVIGVKYARLMFTTESPERCEKIYRAHMNGEVINFDNGTTGGLYYRGVE